MTALARKSRTAGSGDCGGLPAGGPGAREVELMAVSKTYPAATVAEAAALGLTLFGENRVQEFARQGGGAGAAAQRLRKPDSRASDRASAIEQGGAGGGVI
jgi:hypothetical protein